MSIALIWLTSTAAWADPPTEPIAPPTDGPTNNAVLLPPPSDVPVKVPNHTRDRKGEWTAYGGILLVQPTFETNPAFVVTRGGGNISQQFDFSQNLEVAPNLWLGYVSERGWGLRGRWFQFDHDSTASYAAAPGETISGISGFPQGNVPVTGAILATSQLGINVLDFQATYSNDGPKWSYLLGIGVRYTHLGQDYRATLGNDITRIDLSSSHNLNAAGPSFSLEGKRRIGESGFAVYGQLHGAILFGSAHEDYSATNNGNYQEFTRSQRDVLPVGEIELGLEYGQNVGRARLLLQTGFTGQVWWGGGNASNLDPIGPSSAASSNFGLVGLAIRAGVRY